MQHKVRQLRTYNFGVYAWKMLIDGCIVKADYSEQKRLAAAVSRAASNINQVCLAVSTAPSTFPS